MTLNRSLYSVKYLQSKGYKRVTNRKYNPQPEDYVVLVGELTAFRLEYNIGINKLAEASVYTKNIAEAVASDGKLIKNTYCRGYLISNGFKEDLEPDLEAEPEEGDFFNMFETSRAKSIMLVRCEANTYFTQSPAQILRAPRVSEC